MHGTHVPYHSAAAQTRMCKAPLNLVAIIMATLSTSSSRGNHWGALLAHVCGPSIWESGQQDQEFETSLQSNSVPKDSKETHNRDSLPLPSF